MLLNKMRLIIYLKTRLKMSFKAAGGEAIRYIAYLIAVELSSF
jgi:hypothetical protein